MFLYYFDSDTADSARGIIDLYYYTSISIEGENILKLSAPEETGLKYAIIFDSVYCDLMSILFCC